MPQIIEDALGMVMHVIYGKEAVFMAGVFLKKIKTHKTRSNVSKTRFYVFSAKIIFYTVDRMPAINTASLP